DLLSAGQPAGRPRTVAALPRRGAPGRGPGVVGRKGPLPVAGQGGAGLVGPAPGRPPGPAADRRLFAGPGRAGDSSVREHSLRAAVHRRTPGRDRSLTQRKGFRMNLTIDSASFQGNTITASGTALQTFSLSLLHDGTVVQGPVNVTPLMGKWSHPFDN